ncbi:MAG: cobaltochelatase subunit CobN [Methanolobus sp.]
MQLKIRSILVLSILLVSLVGVVSAGENEVNIMYIAWMPDTALETASQNADFAEDINYTYIPSFNTTTWAGPSDELIAAAESGLLEEQDVIFCDMLSASIYEPIDASFKAAHDSGTSLVDIKSIDTPEYFDYVSDGTIDDTICNLYNNMGSDTEEGLENAEELLKYLAVEYGNREDITDLWDEISDTINILYIAWQPSDALEQASQMSEHAGDIKFTYVPSYNTTTWAGPSDELIEAAESGLLNEQDVVFCDMLSASIYEPLDESLSAAHENGVSFIDIRSIDTPEYFDYVSDGTLDDPICNYYNSMGTESEDEQENAQKFLEYLATEYGGKGDITDLWTETKEKIKILYIAWAPGEALEQASINGSHSDEIEYTYLPSYNTTTWAGPSDELIDAAESGLLNEQDVIFCDMLSASIYEPLDESLSAASENGVSLVDIRSIDTPEYFDYVSDGTIDDPICNYYNSMGTETVTEKKNADKLLTYIAKEYGNHPEITDYWQTIKILYIAWAPSDALANASQTNPYSQNIEYTFLPSYNTTTWAGPSDELLEAAASGLLDEQDLIFTDMVTGSIFEPLDQYFSTAHDNGTVLVDIRSMDTPEYFDYVYEGTENETLCNYYNNMGTATAVQLNNAENLLVHLAKLANPEFTEEWEYAALDTIPLPDVGLYHPDYEGKYFETTEEYLTWYSDASGNHRIYDPSKPTIGMWMHRSDVKDGHTEVAEAVLRDIEARDCNVILGFDTFDDIVKYYCDENNQSLVQSVISMKSFRLNYFDNEKGLRELEILDVPVLRELWLKAQTLMTLPMLTGEYQMHR